MSRDRAARRAAKKLADREEKRERQKALSNGLQPIEIEVPYGDAQTLARIGPVIAGRWSVPPQLAAQLEKLGRPVPLPVTGLLLIDTGADHTCIDEDVAVRQLKLTATGMRKTRGAHGVNDSLLYAAHIDIPKLGLSKEEQFHAVPGLSAMFQGLTLSTGNPNLPPALVGLVGRDFLASVRMVYDGPGGTIRLHFLRPQH